MRVSKAIMWVYGIEMTKLTEILLEKLSHVKLVAFDCDGTLWVGDHALDGAIELVNKLRQSEVSIAATTNNSTRNRKSLAKKAAKLGFDLQEDEFYATNDLTVDYVARKYPKGRILVIGSVEFAEMIKSAGIDAVIPASAFEAVKDKDWSDFTYEAVVVGLNVNVTYAELCQSVAALQNGADYIATNPDYTFPVNGDYLMPGNGSFVDLIARVSGVKPSVVLGKPETWLIDAAMRDACVEPAETLTVGDRLDTDIICGMNAGTLTCHVLTGVAASDMKRSGGKSDVRADFVCKDLIELLLIFREVLGGRSL